MFVGSPFLSVDVEPADKGGRLSPLLAAFFICRQLDHTARPPVTP
jgi:hypothetical protein